MRKTWRKAKPKIEKRFRMNAQIRVPEVMLINEEGVNLGAIETRKALILAEEAGLDLVEVNPVAVPPIAKILDYGQFKYEQEKKLKSNAKQKKIEQKAVRLSVRISTHDFEFRVNQAKKFLEKGHTLKAELQLKGRERQHPQIAEEVMKKFFQSASTMEGFKVEMEQALTKKGERFSMVLIAKPK
jgi:translation initiation factor IF-3